MRGFGSDNHSGVHPQILEALSHINTDHAPAYGTDTDTQKARKLFKELFGSSAEAYFVFNGTAANVLCLQALMQSHHSVICHQDAHLNVDECGAPEKHIGCKLIALASKNAKLTPELIQDALIRLGDQHYSQPKVVSITQPTELGTLYSYNEMKAISETCAKHNLLFHIDGARFIYAATGLNKNFNELTEGLNVDALSFGGTKNGLLFGEAVVLFNEEAKKNFKFIRKQAMQLPSKTRFIAGQFQTLLGTSLWQEIAGHGHQLAKYFANELRSKTTIPEIMQSVDANSVFVKIPKAWTKSLKEISFFYVWDEKEWVMRWMMSFDNTKADIDQFIAKIQELEKNEL